VTKQRYFEMRFDEKVYNKFSKTTIIAQSDVDGSEAVMDKWFSRIKLGKQIIINEQKFLRHAPEMI